MTKIKKSDHSKWNTPGIALITGASAGIGAEFARQLAAANFSLILVARRKEKLDSLAKEIKDKYQIDSEIILADLVTNEGVEKVKNRIKELKNLDILVNSAGYGNLGKFTGIELQKNLDLNFINAVVPIHFVHTALQGMIARERGLIINVSSLTVFLRGKVGVIYSASKCHMKVFSETLQKQLKGTGISVQALCPGFTYTEFHDVGDFKDFERGSYAPKKFWMSSKECVEKSLKAVRKGKVVYVPGKLNNFLKGILQTPILGKLIRNRL